MSYFTRTFREDAAREAMQNPLSFQWVTMRSSSATGPRSPIMHLDRDPKEVTRSCVCVHGRARQEHPWRGTQADKRTLYAP